MKIIRTIIVAAACLLGGTLAFSAGNSPQETYIAKYSDLAIKERHRSGVPASITLAQGMLESGNGLSELAVKGNNHFGIKCHDWKGGRIYFDDDRKGECFRKYKNVEQSFRDHSDFLRYRDRYKFLFEFEVTDYESWAYGLKKAGYATDPAYPKKLIRLIEEYNLDRFDRRSSGSKKKDRNNKKDDVEDNVAATQPAADMPQTPIQLETPKPLSSDAGSVFSLSLSRQLYSLNGVPFVYSTEGETYADIAANYDLFLTEILRYNDLEADETLLPGTIVYIQPKKNKAAKHLDKYVAEGGESLRSIAQRYAVKLHKLMKYNGMEADDRIYEGQTVSLRKKIY